MDAVRVSMSQEWSRVVSVLSAEVKWDYKKNFS